MFKRMNWRWLFSWSSLTVGAMVVGVGTGAFFLGRNGAMSEANARPPMQAAAPAQEPQPLPGAPQMSAAYTKGVVAYIYGNVPVTREELGEHLIGRFGAERLETFVNKRIIEHYCANKGITVTAAEVEEDLAETVKGLPGNVTKEYFETKILKARGKTLYEWREDVVRPKLLMNKLCRERVRVEEDDLRKGIEAYHGEKVQVQMICWPKNEGEIAKKMWEKISRDPKAFDQAALAQASRDLARGAGRVDPFGRHTTGSPEVEKWAFDRLEIGEVSPVIATEQGMGFVVIKLLQRIPPDKFVKLEDVRAKLEKEIIEKKLKQEIEVVFAELKKAADPKLLIKKNMTRDDLQREVPQELATPIPGEPQRR